MKAPSIESKVIKEICDEFKKSNPELTTAQIINAIINSQWGYLVMEFSLEEIGYIFGTTRENIRQIEYKAIRKIMNPDSKINKELYEGRRKCRSKPSSTTSQNSGHRHSSTRTHQAWKKKSLINSINGSKTGKEKSEQC